MQYLKSGNVKAVIDFNHRGIFTIIYILFKILATVFSSFSSNASGNPLTKSDLETDCLPAPECQPLTSEGPAGKAAIVKQRSVYVFFKMFLLCLNGYGIKIIIFL